MNKRPQKNNVKNNEIKTATENYHLPDRTYSDYYCKVCNSHMNSSQMWDSHIQGKRHQKKVKDATEKPSVKKLLLATPPEIPLIAGTLMDITEPVVGLKYICEIRKADLLLGPTYKCFLCSGSFATGDILIEHLGSAKHILAYWKEVEPNSLKPFKDYSKGALENVAYDRAGELEQKYGRGTMEVEFEKQTSVLLPSKSRHSDDDHSPPRKRKTEFSDDEDSRDHRPISYRERSPLFDHRTFRARMPSCSPPPMLPNPRSDYRDYNPSRTEMEILKTRREWEMLERERIDRDRAELEFLQKRRELEILEKELQEREILDRDRDRCGPVDTSYRRILPRKERPTRDLNLNIPRQDLIQQQPWPNLPPQSSQQSVVPSSSSHVACEKKKSPTLKDFIEAIKICPASYTITLLEKMGPFEITNDEECQRLYEIAKHIDNNVVKFLLSNLNTEQQKQLFKVIQGNSRNS